MSYPTLDELDELAYLLEEAQSHRVVVPFEKSI